MPGDPYTRRLLKMVFAGSRGGPNRIRLIMLIRDTPMNINQIAERLGLDYKAAQHHARMLYKNSMVRTEGERYGLLYAVSPLLEANMAIFDELAANWNKVNKS